MNEGATGKGRKSGQAAQARQQGRQGLFIADENSTRPHCVNGTQNKTGGRNPRRLVNNVSEIDYCAGAVLFISFWFRFDVVSLLLVMVLLWWA